MKLSPETRAKFAEVLGAQPTERRIMRLLENLLAGTRPLPAPPPAEEDPLDAPLPPDPGPTSGQGVPADVEAARAQVRAYVARRLPPKFVGLEDAARYLMSVLEPGHQDQLMNVHKDEKWPLWVIMAASIARACDNREINTASHMHPDWLNQAGQPAAGGGDVYCEACHLKIPNARRGQQYCCSAHGSGKDAHSPGCPAAVIESTGGETSAAPTVAVEAVAPATLPDGMCTLPGCGLMIVNARRGQLRCCNAHGSDKAEHSPGCETAARGAEVSA